MDEVPKTFAPDLSPAGHKKWIGRLIIAVLAGAALWNFVVALTVDVVLPALARVMEADPQSPLYLGKGDFNLPPLFVAVLELCLAMIAAILVNSWAQSVPKAGRRKAMRSAPTLVPAIAPSVATPKNLAPSPESVAPRPPQPDLPKPAPPPSQPAEAASAKPKKVYYNSVGDPIEEDE
jgi:hypothetical protein